MDECRCFGVFFWETNHAMNDIGLYDNQPNPLPVSSVSPGRYINSLIFIKRSRLRPHCGSTRERQPPAPLRLIRVPVGPAEHLYYDEIPHQIKHKK